MPVRNELVRAEISTAPASAVPIDAPRLVTGVLEPADLAALLDRVPTRRSRSRAARPARRCPRPGEQHRPGHDLGAGAHVEQSDHDHDAREQRQEPESDDAARRRVGEYLGDADGGQQQRDRQRQQPHAGLRSPRARAPPTGTAARAKNSPACRRYWKKNEVSPPRSVGLRSIAGSTSGSAPCSIRWFSHHRNSHMHHPAARASARSTGDRPSHCGAPGFGWTNPHDSGAQDAEHDQRRGRARTVPSRPGPA